jgi:large subunit ribosomal protein L23
MNSLLNQKAQLLSIVQQPCLTEKSEWLASRYRQFVFKIDRAANKLAVKQAIELIFKVEVNKVCIVNVRGKVKRFKQRLGRRKNWKKAYVSLKPSYHIDFNRD